MLEGIIEKMLLLLYDIEEAEGKDSKLYVHAYDVYADLILHKKDIKHPFGNDLTDEIFYSKTYKFKCTNPCCKLKDYVIAKTVKGDKDSFHCSVCRTLLEAEEAQK